ncbi:2-amino-4-hydroxy-6-hydroxymethyldihydropteridine diphosphokinase [Vibrio sp. WJH972]
MTITYVGIGSNIEKHQHIEKAIRAMIALDPAARWSTIYESLAFGFDGDSFFNLVVEVTTKHTLEQFSDELRKIEWQLGRPQDAQKKQSRTIDLDILLFGDCICNETVKVPRQDIYQFPFVIQPLYELCPERVIPGDGRSVKDIWVEFNNLEILSAIKPWFKI